MNIFKREVPGWNVVLGILGAWFVFRLMRAPLHLEALEQKEENYRHRNYQAFLKSQQKQRLARPSPSGLTH